MSRRIAAAGLAFVLTAALRFLNSATAFEGGFPQIRLLDDLYHLKRMTYSAANFPRVLEFDPDRGERGAFCPWPPFYDVAAGGVARTFGATGIFDVLSIVVWIPPLVTATFLALLTFVLWPRAPLAAIVAALTIAMSPSPIVESWIGSIDHHFLEPPIVLAMIGAVVLVVRSDSQRELRAGLLLGVAMTLAMFTQAALLLGCGLAFAICFFAGRARATAVASALTALALVLYRLTCDPAMPNNAWFVGWPHAAIFFGACVASLIAWRMHTRTTIARIAAGVAGSVATLLIPGMVRVVLTGSTFLGGDPLMARVKELQPIWTLTGRPLWIFFGGLIAGAILTIPLLMRGVRRREAWSIAIACFALFYFTVAMTSLRFTLIATCVLAVAGGVCAEMWRRDGRRNVAIAMAIAMILPAFATLILFLNSGLPHPLAGMSEPLQVAGFLRRANVKHERVLAPWMWGHAINVIGGSPVITDNFGTMPDEDAFRRAQLKLLTGNERELAAYCRRLGIRFIVLSPPPAGIAETGLGIGMPLDAFVQNDMLTPRTTSTWWWQAWQRFPTPTREFASAFETRDGSVRVWRLVDDSPRQR
ncbi:MAG TPA: hypothetical protein VF787_17305 [Thermoanaerobaculia bacterium]